MAIGFGKRGLFGAKMGAPIGTPGIGDDIQRQRMGMPDMAPGLGMQAEQPKQGRGSFLPYALAAVEDTLSRQMGYAPQGVARINAQQAAQQQAMADQAAEMRKRSLDMADWQAKKQWEIDNAPPPNNDTINDFEWYKGLSGADKELYHRMKPQNMIVDNGDGTKSIIPIGANGPIVGGGQQQAPSKPVGGLMPMGGPTQPASGGFR